SASPLAWPIDLSAGWNATDPDLAGRFDPLYAPAFARLPQGDVILRGLPFSLGRRSAGRRWVLAEAGQSLELDLAGAGGGAVSASHLVVAHFSDSWREPGGGRPAGMPVGWVLPTGEALARYELVFGDGRSQAIEIQRRVQIDDGIIGWGFLPFEAIGHQADQVLDWRGPFPDQGYGRTAPAGHAGPLTTLPGAWAAGQSGAVDYIPSPTNDLTLWLHAIALEPGVAPVALRIGSLGEGRPGTDVVIAGLTLFAGRASPLVADGRRQFLLSGPNGALPGVDLGSAIRSQPAGQLPATPRSSPIGWGQPPASGDAAAGDSIVDLSLAPDARITFGSSVVTAAELDAGAEVALAAGASIRQLARPDVRVNVRVTAGGATTPARVRFLDEAGRYLPPLGHRDEVNPGIFEDSGAGLILGTDTYAYVPGEFQIDLPVGPIAVELVKGFDHRSVRTTVQVEPGTDKLAFTIDHPIDLRPSGWRSSDSHVHFLAPSTALLQAAAEDVDIVHVLATQLGDHFINLPDLAWGGQQDPAGRHTVMVGTENRQNMLGHLALLGARPPVLPLASGGAPEGRIGQPVSELLADWADRCHAAGGLVVGAHFPLPFAEIAAAVVAGLIDAVEMQVFAPGLDNPSILEWYRFLNCGYRLPVVGGTDKMSAEVALGAMRTYAHLDQTLDAGLDAGRAPSFGAWAAAIRAGRTFATSGPILELLVDGHEPGAVISLP
ncbi:MAG TPA: CehA/McbA family metallohydrolase, partial [Candidatus Limnocylindrales bacterium]